MTGGGALPASAAPVSRSHPLSEPVAGAGYDLPPGLSVSATYAGAFGDSGRRALLVGLNWKF
jgi:fibronectin-binding autotransporter adhesin